MNEKVLQLTEKARDKIPFFFDDVNDWNIGKIKSINVETLKQLKKELDTLSIEFRKKYSGNSPLMTVNEYKCYIGLNLVGYRLNELEKILVDV